MVAGAGTFEPLVVAQAHPRAAEIVALDLSAASLERLHARWLLLRVTRPWLRLPRLRLVQGDLLSWKPEEASDHFDYILASNVLQHLQAPAEGLRRLAERLRPGGLLRLVTYPLHSRYWMRETGRWLRLQGLGPSSPGLVAKARDAVEKLPDGHPVRSCFLSQPERHRAAGLVDAFLHAWETPLSPLEWFAAAWNAGLELVEEDQAETSRAAFLDELVPRAEKLDRWLKLQILDDVLELCANPILIFRKAESLSVPEWQARGARVLAENSRKPPLAPAGAAGAARFLCHGGAGHEGREAVRGPGAYLLPSRTYHELGGRIRAAEELLRGAGAGIAELLEGLKKETGPRVTEYGKPLPGLSILDYDLEKLLAVPQPFDAEDWESLGPGWLLSYDLDEQRIAPPGRTLAEQAAWIQAVRGPMQSLIHVVLEKGSREPLTEPRVIRKASPES